MSSSLKGKKVLVTGAEGFIASHLVEELVVAGAHVRALVLYNSFGSWGWLDTFPKEILGKIEVVLGDVRDPRHTEKVVKDCEIVFHLAALIAIPFSYEAPDAFIDTNIRGTVNVLHAARAHGTKRVLITSTSEVYGTAQYVPMDEKHPFQGQSPYSASKIAADRMAESFVRSFDTPIVTVRPFNAYGPRQSTRAIIPTVITQLLAGKKTLALGRLDPIRDFNYVKDIAKGFVVLATTKGVEGQEVNIATGKGTSIQEVVEILMRITGHTATIKTDRKRLRPAASEVDRLIGSAEKMYSLTGWRPTFSLEEGLVETVAWFSEPHNLGRYRADTYTI